MTKKKTAVKKEQLKLKTVQELQTAAHVCSDYTESFLENMTNASYHNVYKYK